LYAVDFFLIANYNVWAHKTSLTVPLFIEVPVFWNCSDRVVFFCFSYYIVFDRHVLLGIMKKNIFTKVKA